MGVSLTKGQVVNLTKATDKLSNVVVGLGWQMAKPKIIEQKQEEKKGFFKKLFGNVKETVREELTESIDCDAVAYVIDDKGKNDMVYYGSKRHSSGCVTHMGDNLVGNSVSDADEYKDAEQIKIKLDTMPNKYNKIVIGVNIYQAFTKHQDFGMIEKAFIRLTNEDTKEQLCQFNLSDDYAGKTGMLLGELTRTNGDWTFKALGDGYSVANLDALRHFVK